MLGAALLHAHELAQVRQRRLHLWIRRPQRRPLDGALQELAGKRRVHRQARVAAKRGLLLAAVKVGGRLACRPAAPRLRRGYQPAAGIRRDAARRGKTLEKTLYAAETGLDLVNLALTTSYIVSVWGVNNELARQEGLSYYCEDMRTRWRGSLGRWPAPVDVHGRLAVRQLEQGQSLSQRIYQKISCK